MAGRFWREASSLILVGKGASKNIPLTRNTNYVSDYEVLMMKRSAKSKFMPEFFVFPGGTIDKSDLSKRWLNIFKSHGFMENDILKTLRYNGAQRPECYLNKSPTEDLVPELAFRICALRETFEETGILLVADTSNNSPSGIQCIADIEDSYLEQWRKRIVENGSNFMDLFEDLNKIPGVWGLHEWSNWLTPTFFEPKSRFDTIFYVTFLNHELPMIDQQDKNESEEFLATSPIEIVSKQAAEKKMIVGLPQLYEFGRFLNFPMWEDLKEFSERRAKIGTSRFLSFPLNTNNGKVFLLPGDDLYPKEFNIYDTQESPSIDATQEELLESGSCFHRSGYNSPLFIKNVKPDSGHLHPLTLDSLIQKS